MADNHEHNTSGATRTSSAVIGTELVSYAQVFCTCGRLMENNITGRTPLAPRESTENK